MAARQPRGDLVVDVQDGEDFQGGEAVQGDEEDEGEAVVEGGALLEAGVALLGDGLLMQVGGDGEDCVPELPQEGVEGQENGHEGEVLAEGVVLRVGYVLEDLACELVTDVVEGVPSRGAAYDLATRDPAVGEEAFVLVVSGVRGCKRATGRQQKLLVGFI
ncbi:hypothetical protein Ct61P_09518 [Colletotrichum tofieldiae]|nr:hypothetical protein Ct61P_09518 [Colletotrichum tofieldiae]